MQIRRLLSLIPPSSPLARRCLAQSTPFYGFGGLILRQSMSTLRTRRYKTIRITRNEDVDRLYQLMAAYIEQPSLAESVTEVILDASTWFPPPSRCDYEWFHQMEDEAAKDKARQMILAEREARRTENDLNLVTDDAHSTLRAYVQDLGLGEELKKKMLKSLAWKHQHQEPEERLEAADFEEEDERAEEKSIASHYAYAATASTLILLLCKRIITLRLGRVRVGSDQLRDFLLETNYNALDEPALQNLETVELLSGHGIMDDQVYGTVEFLEYFQYFHRLPAIRSISSDGVQEYQAERTIFPPRTGNMKKISIEHADVSRGMLCIIILIPKALEEFRLSLGGLWSTDGGLPVVIPGDLGKALFQHKKTLKILDLDIDYALHNGRNLRMAEEVEDDELVHTSKWLDLEKEDYGQEYFRLDEELSQKTARDKKYPGRYGNTVGSLYEFRVLTHLKIGIKALMGSSELGLEPPYRLVEEPPFRLVDALPPNLEYLCLYGYEKGLNKEIDSHVKELMEKKGERLPRLKLIEGIDQLVSDLGSIHSEDDQEEDLWVRPEREFHWKEANK